MGDATSSHGLSSSAAYRAHTNKLNWNAAGIDDGNWHRITFHIYRESAVDAGDGIIQAWGDGRLVMDDDGSDPTSPAYHKVYTGGDNLHNAFGKIQYPTAINNPVRT